MRLGNSRVLRAQGLALAHYAESVERWIEALHELAILNFASTQDLVSTAKKHEEQVLLCAAALARNGGLSRYVALDVRDPDE